MDGGAESSADRPDPDPGPDGSDGSDGNVAFANDPNDPKDAGSATAAAAARSFAASGIREMHAATASASPRSQGRSARAHDDANATDPDRSNEFFFRGSESVFSFDAAIDGDAKDDADAENSDADAENSDADAEFDRSPIAAMRRRRPRT